MLDYLQTTIDKFTFRVAKDRLYTAEGMWLLPVQDQGSQRVRIGVTDFFQQHNGDVAFANVKAVGVSLHAEDELAEMETMKVTDRSAFASCRDHRRGQQGAGAHSRSRKSGPV